MGDEDLSGGAFDCRLELAASAELGEGALYGCSKARGMFMGPGSGKRPFGGTRKMTSTLS